MVAITDTEKECNQVLVERLTDQRNLMIPMFLEPGNYTEDE
ncbi:hypothetical protein FF38_03880 [Lucilia cuprina]|uniref:Uncharacterized protein n=1 Tax=Lucilia cuprina TaxID=7375 RepID=A0A0L0CG89_LUCCU|nr:hypothetical protein FF38_03880 [Lucilia cuprina]